MKKFSALFSILQGELHNSTSSSLGASFAMKFRRWVACSTELNQQLRFMHKIGRLMSIDADCQDELPIHTIRMMHHI